MSDIDWNRIRPLPYDDDPLDRAELISEMDRLRGLLAERSEERQPTSIVVGELRKLSGEVATLRDRLPPLLVTMDVAAEVLGVSLSTIRRMVKAGDLASRSFGRSVRVDLSKCKGLDGQDIAQLAREARGRLAGE